MFSLNAVNASCWNSSGEPMLFFIALHTASQVATHVWKIMLLTDTLKNAKKKNIQEEKKNIHPRNNYCPW